mmetsp:Transcript_34840/g.62750  ORF Transcript_34840/g.62750 Transcript_34840/m.62750 type:complete len:88 (+) Transcript_34840:209-472(+)
MVKIREGQPCGQSPLGAGLKPVLNARLPSCHELRPTLDLSGNHGKISMRENADVKGICAQAKINRYNFTLDAAPETGKPAPMRFPWM